MTRTALTAAAALALVVILAAICLAAPARSFTPTAYQPVTPTQFSTWPVDPIRRPTVPGSAGSKTSLGAEPSGSLAGGPRPSSTPPTSRPTGQLVPPVVATKGTAGVATWYDYHPGQAAAAARLRAALGPDWRGQLVLVCHDGECLRIRLTDYESSQIPGRLIDLDASDFRRLCGPLGLGVCAVTVTGE